MIEGNQTSIDKLNARICKEFKELFHTYNQENSKYENSLKKDFVIALCHMYLSLKSEEELPFLKSGHVFDWKEFESNLNLEFVNGT